MTAERITIGWREWLHLPDLEVRWIKAKVDTGARTSALHAEQIEYFTRGGRKMVRFAVHPNQDDKRRKTIAECRLLEMRAVRSSNGTRELRPVIETSIDVGDEVWPVELTLTHRDVMGFRMLLGRQAIRGYAVVDPGRSHVTRKKKKKKKAAGTKKAPAKKRTTKSAGG